MIRLYAAALIAALLCLSAAPVKAATVSFVVAESGQGREGYSAVWEDGLMGAFYEAGHIVSAGDRLRVTAAESGFRAGAAAARTGDAAADAAGDAAESFPDAALRGFDEAVEGGAEYFVLAVLNYAANGGANGAAGGANAKAGPGTVSLRVFSGKPGADGRPRLIYRRDFDAGARTSPREEYARVREAATAILPRLRG